MITAGILMAFTVSASLFAVTVRNVLHAIFGLAAALFGVAGLFLTLNSPFVATMEILIYVGGISIAMIFAVMLSTVILQKPDGGARRALAALAAIGFFVGMALLITRTSFGPESNPDPERWTVAAMGHQLLTHYNVVFELLSIVLLLAIVGAIAISRKESVPAGAAGIGVVALTESIDGDSVKPSAAASDANADDDGDDAKADTSSDAAAAEAEAAADADADVETAADTDADSDVEAAADTDADSDVEAAADTDADSDVEAAAEAEAEAKAEPVAKADSEGGDA